MAIDSDTNEHGVFTIAAYRSSRCDRNSSVYSDFERLFRPALRGHGLPVQRVGGECAGFAKRRVTRRYDHSSCRNICLDIAPRDYKRNYAARPNHHHGNARQPGDHRCNNHSGQYSKERLWHGYNQGANNSQSIISIDWGYVYRR